MNMTPRRKVSHIGHRLNLLSTAVLAATAVLMPASASAQTIIGNPVPGVEEFEGVSSDGSPFLVRKPSNWNGIVLIDLDGYERSPDAAYELLLKAGYGTAGADRRAGYAKDRSARVPIDRAWTLNRYEDMRRPLEALEMHKARFGKPKRVIAFGRSAGGSTALLTSEQRPDTVDGAVAMCATMDFVGYTGYNLIFDFLYVLKALLAPNDERLLTHGLRTEAAGPVLDHWRKVLQEAAKTPEGRGRMALAFTLVQYPLYVPNGGEWTLVKPDHSDPDTFMKAAVENSLSVSRRLGLLTVHGPADFPLDLAVPGTPVSNPVGNDGAVYADYWKDADPEIKKALEAYYARAGLDLAADLRTVDASPRVSLDRDNLRRGVLARGLPSMPVFRMDNLGDKTAPWRATKLYDRLVENNGLGALYRTSYVDNSGHCRFKPQQEFAAVEVMRERLETGKWPATDAAALNKRAGRNDGDGVIFVDPKPGSHTTSWRLEAHTDLFRPATFASVSGLLNGYKNSLSPGLKQQLLAHLAEAERAAGQGQGAQAGAALGRFVSAANGVTNRVVRTRLLAAARQLPGGK